VKPRVPAAAVILALAAALAVTGCTDVSGMAFPTPAPTSPAPTTTAAPDLAGAKLAAVAGQTSSTVAVRGGSATLTGIVLGPSGPVGGANVHVERLLGDAVAAVDVAAQADGTWSLGNLLGGRFRIRAWRSPDLDLTTALLFFLNGTDTKSLTLQLQQFNATNVAVAVAPNPPTIGLPAALAVRITTQVVDASGVVRPKPIANASVELTGSPAWTVSGANPAMTGADGSAVWQATCAEPGPQTLTAVVNTTNVYPLNVPACIAPPPPTTSLPPTSTTVPGGSTTTVRLRTATSRARTTSAS